MKKRIVVIVLMLFVFVGCVVQVFDIVVEVVLLYFILNEVVVIVGFNQDLIMVWLDLVDDCYWYYYVGLVEMMLVLLWVVNGNYICNVCMF